MSIVLIEVQDILDNLYQYRHCTVVEDDRMHDAVQITVPRSWKDRIFNGNFFQKESTEETLVPSTKARVVGNKIFVHSTSTETLVVALYNDKRGN